MEGELDCARDVDELDLETGGAGVSLSSRWKEGRLRASSSAVEGIEDLCVRLFLLGSASSLSSPFNPPDPDRGGGAVGDLRSWPKAGGCDRPLASTVISSPGFEKLDPGVL